jgi:hypothetical protein
MKAKSTNKELHDGSRIITMRELHRERYMENRMIWKCEKIIVRMTSPSLCRTELYKRKYIRTGTNPEFD